MSSSCKFEVVGENTVMIIHYFIATTHIIIPNLHAYGVDTYVIVFDCFRLINDLQTNNEYRGSSGFKINLWWNHMNELYPVITNLHRLLHSFFVSHGVIFESSCEER